MSLPSINMKLLERPTVSPIEAARGSIVVRSVHREGSYGCCERRACCRRHAAAGRRRVGIEASLVPLIPLEIPRLCRPRRVQRSAASVDRVSARLDAATTARLAALAPLLTPLGSQPSRSIAVRACILTGLDALEALHGTGAR